jgi:multiple sugar transport system substrate-binding protein
MEKKKLSRRDFLRWSAVAATGAVVAAGCQPTPVEKIVKETVVVEKEKVVKETVVVEKEVEKVVTPTPVPVETVDIDFWWGWTPEIHVNALNAACRRFEELNPEIKVNTAQHEWGPKLFTALAAGTPPDLFQWGNAVEMAAREAVIPLDDRVDASEALSWDSFYDVSWDLSKWEGKLYGVPGLEQFAVIGQIASVELWDQAGLDVPGDLPETFSEAMQQVEAYTQRDEAGNITVLWGEVSRENWYWWEVVLGVHAYDKETGTYDFTDPLWVEAIKWTGDLYQMLGPEKLEGFREAYPGWKAATGNAFASGTQAWETRSGYWEPGELAKTAPDKEFYWHWNPMWDHRKGIKTQEIGGHALCIPKDGQHPDEAWKLTEFLVSLEALKIIFEGCGFLTATKEFVDDPGKVVDFYKYPGLRFFVDSVRDADELWAEPRGPVDGFVFDKFYEYGNAVIYGDMTPEEAMVEIQTLVGEEVARVKRE